MMEDIHIRDNYYTTEEIARWQAKHSKCWRDYLNGNVLFEYNIFPLLSASNPNVKIIEHTCKTCKGRLTTYEKNNKTEIMIEEELRDIVKEGEINNEEV